MIKIFITVALLFFLVPAGVLHAQETPKAAKIYSGRLYLGESKEPFWRKLFGTKSPKPEDVQDKLCSVEFDSPVPFSHEPVTVVPGHLVYSIHFKNPPPSFEKFTIKIYTNDEEEYSIPPDPERKIFDEYLIYLILGRDINHLEVVSASSNEQDKYILDKMEIHDNP